MVQINTLAKGMPMVFDHCLKYADQGSLTRCMSMVSSIPFLFSRKSTLMREFPFPLEASAKVPW